MMYDPNVFTLNLEQLLSGTPLDAAIGVIQVTVEAARGLKANKIGGGSPDPYVSISINNREELAKTKYRESTSVFFHIVLLPRPYFYLQIQPNMDGDQIYSGQLPSRGVGA
jgi:hypothetical protein